VIDFFLGFRLSRNTIRTYGSHFRTFLRICDTFGIDPHGPLDESDLCLVVAAYADCHKITTVPGFISAIASATRDLFGTELPRQRLFQQMKQGLENYYGDDNFSAAKDALTLDDFRAFLSFLDTRYFEHARDWCAFLLAFFGLLRINEYMNSGLRMRHVVITSYGIDVTVVRSKTSLISVTITLSARHDLFCPVRALSTYLSFFPALDLPRQADDPLFVTRMINGSTVTPMSDSELIARLRSYIAAAFPHRDPTCYAGHSFRRGGASALHLAGVSAADLQRHGRWTSDAYRGYIDAVSNPAVRLRPTQTLLHSSQQ
jgi:hypothetical protein